MSEHKINSMDYWDNRFQTNWENFLGREQTEFFINLLLENLPQWLLDEVEENKYSICDAGCAEGDGTKILTKKFPKSDILGIDFSIEAVNKANEYYPDVKFAQGDIMNLSQHFDIVLCSNVLEHFSKPFEIIPHLIDKTVKHLIIMVPFLEFERIKEHSYTFEYSSFKLEINNYNLTYFKEIDCKLIEGTHWYGKQAIVIYSNREVKNNNILDLAALNRKEEFYENEYFKQLDKISKLEEKVEKQEQDVQWYRTQIQNTDNIVGNLTNTIAENEKVIHHFLKENEVYKLKFNQLEQQIAYNNEVLYNTNHQLISMQKTKGWRILNRYYRLANSMRNLKGNTKKFMYISKTKGFKEALKRSFVYLNYKETSIVVNNSSKLLELYAEILNKYKSGMLKGLAIIPSAFEFDELYNQRTINLAKYLANEGYAVVYVAWQWNKNEILDKSYKCFLDKIYQVPLFDFLETQFDLINEISDKKYIITFPTEEFYKLITSFRESSFQIVYDIMDEWEEFYNTGEAPWYKKKIEEAIVLNADLVVGVSEPLKEKFSFLRNDVVVIGNGYDENISVMKNISLKSEANDNKIHIGYFGHLTSAWFDWDLVFELANQETFFIHLIGYGVDNKILNRLEEFENIKFYGKVHPGELHNHVRNWHIGLIPFKQSKLSIAVDPIKVYEYLFFGLPTISTGIPHIGSYPLVAHCKDTSNVIYSLKNVYSKILSGALEEDKLEEFLIDSTWENRFEKMMYEIDASDFFQYLYERELK